MKVVVIGGSGTIGKKLVADLRVRGHETVAASRRTGVDVFTGHGLSTVLRGADVVVDVSDCSRAMEEGASDFFRTSTENMLKMEADSGVGHHVVLSAVGTQRMALNHGDYFSAKQAQEDVVSTSAVPYSIVRCTQPFEYVRGIGDAVMAERSIRLPSPVVQPIAGDDVALALARTAINDPTRRVLEVAGPEQFRLTDLVRLDLRSRSDARQVVTDPLARYRGVRLRDGDLLPSLGAHLFATRWRDWALRPRMGRSAATTTKQETPPGFSNRSV